MKKEILLFTGWGATCDVWEMIIPALSEGYQINCHTPSWLGENKMCASLSNFDEYIDELGTAIKSSKSIIAWSMGGLIAIALAKRYPQLIKKICFVSSVPNFVAKDDPYAGIDFDWFQEFLYQYQQRPLKTLKKFLTLQVKGDEFAKQTLVNLKKYCQFDVYNLIECGYGLELLCKLNLKEDLTSLDCDTVFIHGKQDAVIAPQAVEHIVSYSNSSIHWIENAGHVPQLSHAEQVLCVIEETFNS